MYSFKYIDSHLFKNIWKIYSILGLLDDATVSQSWKAINIPIYIRLILIQFLALVPVSLNTLDLIQHLVLFTSL